MSNIFAATNPSTNPQFATFSKILQMIIGMKPGGGSPFPGSGNPGVWRGGGTPSFAPPTSPDLGQAMFNGGSTMPFGQTSPQVREGGGGGGGMGGSGMGEDMGLNDMFQQLSETGAGG